MVSLQAARGTRYAPLTITPAAEFETLSMRDHSKSGIGTAAHLIGWHMMRNLVSPLAYVRYAPQPGGRSTSATFAETRRHPGELLSPYLAASCCANEPRNLPDFQLAAPVAVSFQAAGGLFRLLFLGRPDTTVHPNNAERGGRECNAGSAAFLPQSFAPTSEVPCPPSRLTVRHGAVFRGFSRSQNGTKASCAIDATDSLDLAKR